jgi:hypothetical protein
VTGADYGAVRVGAFMGYRVLADLAGFPVTAGDGPRHVRVDDPSVAGLSRQCDAGRLRWVRRAHPRHPDGRRVPDALRRHYGSRNGRGSCQDLRRANTDRASRLRALARQRVGAPAGGSRGGRCAGPSAS